MPRADNFARTAFGILAVIILSALLMVGVFLALDLFVWRSA